MLRQIAERFSRNLVVRRRLSADFGRRPFYASPGSALAYMRPGLSGFADLTSIAAECVSEGQCVWDIGGNLGVFSFLAAHRVGLEGTVISVEPDPFLASLIQKSALLKENQDRSVHVLCAAVAEHSSIAKFLVAERGRSSNSLEQSGQRVTAGGVRYTQYVPTMTLDQMLEALPKPQFLKVDVEGAEALVLRGGQSLLRNIRPQIYIEVGREQATEVTEILRSHRYSLFAGDPTAGARTELKTCQFNTLAVPAESITAEVLSRAA